MKICKVCGLDETKVKFYARSRKCSKCCWVTRQQKLQLSGLCRCGAIPKRDRTKCEVCLKSGAKRTKKLQDGYKSKGLCPCGNVRDSKRVYCRACLDQQLEITLAKQRASKRRAVEMFGNVCADCKQPYIDEVFDFHHLDPDKKASGISKLIKSAGIWAVIEEELKKCVMLCSNCHRIRHATKARGAKA
jgi:hypothetical protein